MDYGVEVAGFGFVEHVYPLCNPIQPLPSPNRLEANRKLITGNVFR